MTKFLEFLKSLNGDTFKIIAVIIIIGFLAWLYGCESKVQSIAHPEIQVNRAELQAEITAFNAQAKAKISNLDKQDEIKAALLNELAVQTNAGTFNPIGLANSILTIGALGIAIDSRKKLNNANKANRLKPA